MTKEDFEAAVRHQERVKQFIETILHSNGMSLAASNGAVWLCDDERDIGNTGFEIK